MGHFENYYYDHSHPSVVQAGLLTLLSYYGVMKHTANLSEQVQRVESQSVNCFFIIIYLSLMLIRVLS